jgi:hypothetical protein
MPTSNPNKWACISNMKTGGNRYTGSATMTEQTCTEKGQTFEYGKNDNHLLTIDIIKALYKAASGQTCYTHTGQSGGCGWGEIMQPHKDNTCNTPHDCNTGNWMKGDPYPTPAETNSGSYANKWAISICGPPKHPNHCLPTSDSNKFACISNKKGVEYSGSAIVTQQTCTEKGLKFALQTGADNGLFKGSVKGLYKVASGRHCTELDVQQSGGCGWWEIIQPNVQSNGDWKDRCVTPFDCLSNNQWNVGGANPTPSDFKNGNDKVKNTWVMSICSK